MMLRATIDKVALPISLNPFGTSDVMSVSRPPANASKETPTVQKLLSSNFQPPALKNLTEEDLSEASIKGAVQIMFFGDDPSGGTVIPGVYEIRDLEDGSIKPEGSSNCKPTLTLMGHNDVLVWTAEFDKMSSISCGSLSLIVFESRDPRSARNIAQGKLCLSLPPSVPVNGNSDCSDTLAPPVHLRFLSVSELERFKSVTRQNRTHLDFSENSAIQSYFQYYGKMASQMNMLQDTVRTKTYQEAILSNPTDFTGARVMDVGGGTGILSFFAAQRKALKVFVVELSSVATAIPILAEGNAALGSRLQVLHKTVESVDLDLDLEGLKVDVLVSEPIGTFIFNERMLESFLYARDHFLKKGGRLYPNRCRLFLAPFCDQQLFNDVSAKCNFWANQNFHGVNLSPVLGRALDEQFRQPVVDCIDPSSIVCQTWHEQEFDLETISPSSLADMEFHFRFPISAANLIHGIAGWFDVMFDGSDRQLGFSTAPWCTPTHWQQIRFLFRQPLAVNAGQVVTGSLRMIANCQQSYFITSYAAIEGTSISTATTIIDLKDPDYRYYSNPQSFVPHVTQGTSESTTNPFVKTGLN